MPSNIDTAVPCQGRRANGVGRGAPATRDPPRYRLVVR